ncbi:MAG TPA: GNAT family N-acetyltransferase, partial [Saliniramus sp.]|nr:GNAT family N-acetyltransferase [Saliniramus sp.]
MIPMSNASKSATKFRTAQASDLPAIVALLADDALGAAREIVEDPPARCYLDAFDAIARDPNQLLLLAEQDRRVVGCLQLTFIPGLSR